MTSVAFEHFCFYISKFRCSSDFGLDGQKDEKFLLVPHPGQMCAKINLADDDQKQVEASDTKLQCVFESSELSYIVNWIKNKEYEDDIKCRWYHIGMVCDRILLISSLWVVVYLAVQLS